MASVLPEQVLWLLTFGVKDLFFALHFVWSHLPVFHLSLNAKRHILSITK